MLGSIWNGVHMSYVKDILQEEFERLQALSQKYHAEIRLLPKGSVSIKKRSHKEYLYLAYREKDRVKFEYVGPVISEKAMTVTKKIEQRKVYEQKLKQVKKDLVEIKKVLNGRKI